MYGCPGCGGMMTFDIPGQCLKCGHCGRTESVEEADAREARKAGSNFSVDLLTCPTCGAEIRAMNTAQAAFCSYCGSSVLLERRTDEMDAPETLAPFRITREECFEKYKAMLNKSLCADHRLKKDVKPESFRGIYVPHYIYSAAVQGEAELEGTQTRGNDTYYYKTNVQLDHRFENILHDASREMPDALSEKIDKVKKEEFRPFSPAYLSGFFSDVPDTEESAYIPYAKAECVRLGLKDVMGDLKGGIHYSTGEAEKKLISLADAKCTGKTLVPVWFMSIRSKGRILYAVQNGVTGEMTADIPMDIPRFALFALILAVPLFFLFNSFLTLRPEMTLILSMALALGTQLFVNLRRQRIADRELSEKAKDGGDDVKRRLKQRKRFAKIAGGLGMGETFGGIGGLFALFLAVTQLGKVNDSRIFTYGSLGLTALMAILVLWGVQTKVRMPAGSFAALGAMALGTLNLLLNPFHSDDLAVYVTVLLCIAAVVWICVDLLMLHNRECSNALPQFQTHTGGEGNA